MKDKTFPGPTNFCSFFAVCGLSLAASVSHHSGLARDTAGRALMSLGSRGTQILSLSCSFSAQSPDLTTLSPSKQPQSAGHAQALSRRSLWGVGAVSSCWAQRLCRGHGSAQGHHKARPAPHTPVSPVCIQLSLWHRGSSFHEGPCKDLALITE